MAWGVRRAGGTGELVRAVVSAMMPAAPAAAATSRNGTATVDPLARRAPLARLATTTLAENTPCARAITGRLDARSADPAAALIATSTAPDVAPTSASPTDRLTNPWPVRATATPAPPR